MAISDPNMVEACIALGIVDPLPTGWLEIDGALMNCPAWGILDFTDLWLGGDQRGDDRVLPGIDGVLPFKRHVTTTTKSLPMVINGRCDYAGAQYADPWDGLYRNLLLLRQYVTDPTGTGDGTRAATLHLPDTAITVLTAKVTQMKITLGQKLGGVATATFDFVLPEGQFK